MPRTRYCRKIGFKSGPDISPKDEVFVIEVKGLANSKSRIKGYERLQKAIDDSSKDITRYSESLNAIKRRLKDAGEKDKISLIERFQNYADRGYIKVLFEKSPRQSEAI